MPDASLFVSDRLIDLIPLFTKLGHLGVRLLDDTQIHTYTDTQIR